MTIPDMDESFGREEYVTLLDLYYGTLEALVGTQVENQRLKDLEHLSQKIFLHAVGALQFVDGISVPEFPPERRVFVDITSPFVLMRSIFEAYLILHYIFLDSSGETEEEFRWACWQLESICQKLEVNPLHSAEALQQRDRDQDTVDKLKQVLAGNAQYQKLSPNQQSRALRGKLWGDIVQRIELANRAGFSAGLGESLYRWSSWHAHSGVVALWQMNQAVSGQKTEAMIWVCLGVICTLLACTIESYILKFPRAHECVKSEPREHQALLAAAAILREYYGKPDDISPEVIDEWRQQRGLVS